MEQGIRAEMGAGKNISQEEFDTIKQSVVEKYNRLIVNNDQLSPEEKKAWSNAWRVAIDSLGFHTSSPVISSESIVRGFLDQIKPILEAAGVSLGDEKTIEMVH